MAVSFAIEDFGSEAVENNHRCAECPKCMLCGEVFQWYHQTSDHIEATGHENVVIWSGKGAFSMAAVHSCGCANCVETYKLLQRLFDKRFFTEPSARVRPTVVWDR